MVKRNLKVLAIVRKRDFYSMRFIKLLNKKVSKVSVFYSEDKSKKSFKKKLKKWKGDYIFSYRSKYILGKTILNNVKKFAINFHPGPPEYRGIGCLNFAILSSEKKFGVTAHIINNKIDDGKILKVKYFKIYKKQNLKKILDTTHKHLYNLSKKVLDHVLKSEKFSKVKQKWSKKLYRLKDLEDLYNLNVSMKKYDLNKILRATLINNYKPYLINNKKKFYIS